MNGHLSASVNPGTFGAVRRDFERKFGLRTDSRFAAVSLAESETDIVLTFDLPGVSEDDVTLAVEDGELRLSGERRQTATEGAREVYSNRPTGPFQRSLQLHESIDPDSIDATLSDGVLTVRMSRYAQAQPRKITVRTAR